MQFLSNSKDFYSRSSHRLYWLKECRCACWILEEICRLWCCESRFPLYYLSLLGLLYCYICLYFPFNTLYISGDLYLLKCLFTLRLSRQFGIIISKYQLSIRTYTNRIYVTSNEFLVMSLKLINAPATFEEFLM